MVVRSLKNQYRGINAHLHSLWQASGGWDEFHAIHIVFLANALKMLLRPLGYTASVQQSLQIRRFGEPAGKPESDVTIYDPDVERASQPAAVHPGSSTQVIPVLELLNIAEVEVSQYRAVVVYAAGDKGTPVAWIDLLSPSNKPGGQDAAYYDKKHLNIMQSGAVLVEIDYLHESAPTFVGIPNYRYPSPRSPAHAYRIVVVDPRPAFVQGKAYLHEFDVDAPIPTVEIPLSGADQVQVDFDAIYRRTFEESLLGDTPDLDYSQLPKHFIHYSPSDQARIVSRMLAVLEAVHRGENLDSGEPLPVIDRALEEGLARINELVSPS